MAINLRFILNSFYILFAVVLYSNPIKVYSNETIQVAGIDWCPQICPNTPERPGYIVEIINQLFNDSEYKINIDYFPWSRAIRYVKQGKYSVLIAPAKKEAPSLTFPKIPIGIQRMCFYTLSENSWRYHNKHSLKGLKIGIAEDSSIEELNDYIKHNIEQFQMQPYHERFVPQNINKLLKNRIDAFVFTRNSTNYIASESGFFNKIKQSGCVSEAPVYFAITPTLVTETSTIKLKHQFETRMYEMIENGKLDIILNNYDTALTSQDFLKYYK